MKTLLFLISLVLSTNALFGQEIKIGFKDSIESKENVICKLKIYEDEGHVPFQSLYHGLRFIYSSK